MDLSKLPRLSQTDQPAPAHPPTMTSDTGQQVQRPAVQHDDSAIPSAPGGDIWISLAVGILIQ
jgi:hypothetical protein